MAYLGQKYTAFNPKITLSNNFNVDGLISGNLDDIAIVSNVLYVKQYALAYTNGIISISLPDCEEIGQYVFSNCSDLAALSLLLVEVLPQRFISNCNNLKVMSLPSVREYTRYCFSSMNANFEEVKLNASIPFCLSFDAYSAISNLEGELLTITIDTSDDDYEEALDYVLSLNFSEFQLYDENGSEIII